MKLQKISETNTVREVIDSFPETKKILLRHGINCIGCHASYGSTIEQAIYSSGKKFVELNELINELNESIEKD